MRAELADAARELDRIVDGLAKLIGPADATVRPEPGAGGPAEAAILAVFGYPADPLIAADERRDMLRIAGNLGMEASVAVPGALLALLADDRVGAGAPAIGATGLMPRLLRARCWQLGLMDGPPTGAPWRPQELTEVRRRLAEALDDEAVSDADAVRLIGRPLELLDRLWRRDPHGYVVLDPTGNGSNAFERLRVNAAGEFEQGPLPFLKPSSDGPRTPDLRVCRGGAANRLALRALQLWLWRLGLLDGPVSDATDYRGRPAPPTGSGLPSSVRRSGWSLGPAMPGDGSCAGTSAVTTRRSICTSSSSGWRA